MPYEVHKESAAQSIVDAFVVEQLARIEEVTWMLPVERSDKLSCIEVGEG
jgi:hypothetical protein